MLELGNFISRIFYATYSLLSNHPALKQFHLKRVLLISFDDFHHKTYLLSYWKLTPLFGPQKNELLRQNGINSPIQGSSDYQFSWMPGPYRI
jgi:hypothetical protein